MLFLPGFVPANGAIEAAITIAVLVIAFIGWLVQIAGQAKGPGAEPTNRPRPQGARPAAQAGQRRPQPRPRDERLQSEIDAFLREVSSGRKPATKEEDIAIEVIPEEDLPEERPRRVTAQAGQFFPPSQGTVPPIVPQAAPTGQVSNWDREHQRRRERLLSTVAERHLDSTPLAAELKQHLDQYMAESIQLRKEKEQVEQRLAATRAELQAMRAQSPGVVAGPVRAETGLSRGSRFAVLLKQRRTVKDAIVINEILGQPKGSTRTSRS